MKQISSTKFFLKNSKKPINFLSIVSEFHTTCTQFRVLTIHNMNENVKNMQYAVRGSIVLRAGVIENQIANVLLK